MSDEIVYGNHYAYSYTGDGANLTNLTRANVAPGTANHVIVNDGAGTLSSIPALDPARGGTGLTGTPGPGQIAIGTGTGYALANITSTLPITITNGPGSIALSVPDSSITSAKLTNTGVVAGSYTNTNLTVDSAGRVTAAANGSGGGGGGGSVGGRIQVLSHQVNVDFIVETTIAYIPWKALSWAGTTTRTFYLYVAPNSSPAIFQARDNGGAVLGFVSVSAGAPSSLLSFTITAPTDGGKIDFTVQRTGGVAPYTSIFGIIFEAT